MDVRLSIAWRFILRISIIWASCLAIGGIISGAIGGFFTAKALRQIESGIRKKQCS